MREHRGKARNRISCGWRRRSAAARVEAYGTVGYRFCAKPALDHLDREAWQEWRNAA